MTVTLSNLLTLFSMAIAIVVGIGAAVTYFGSRFRRGSDALREQYIKSLEDSRKELERENKTLLREVSELRGAVRALQEMVMGRCRNFAVDPVSGGCSHCALGLAYGQPGSQQQLRS